MLELDHDLLLVHVASSQAYAQAHVPGAILVTPAELVDGTPPASGRLPDLGRLTALFRRIGFDFTKKVVAYDDEGGGWAGRFCWTLDVIGKRDWHYLNGGIQAWLACGRSARQGNGAVPAPSQVHLTIDTGPIAEIEDVLAAIDDPRQLIWDVRSDAEYRGERSGSARAGHIPGAVNTDWMHLKDPAHDMRLIRNLDGLLNAVGVTAEKQIITHCQTHHRSGLSYMVARLLGFQSIRAYHGSWSEWGNRADLPIET
ncbi:MAG: rhodanese-like domain-containing protein [Pseudomonadales bacterium]|nr:rhodanese-like domain-containing protein [Pseudomonadales bacterium]MDP6469553.1 rhodanese-like domain-containing protein [Pseudomonadales bacterium]MDP6827394.1 rhodanese-like domain-containing protein [Pseudomonadales bacterium]MDP6971217.1 rhodanese-like domain-containing protein [Pseudomonadales bacterium]